MIKRVAILFAVAGLMSFTHRAEDVKEVDWMQWNPGFAMSNETAKIALIDVYTDWCGWCKRMDKTTYASEAIIDKIAEHFVPIKFNPEKPGNYHIGNDTLSGRQLLQALSQNNPSGYPTTYFYIPSKRLMYQYPGYMDAEKFMAVLDEMIAAANK